MTCRFDPSLEKVLRNRRRTGRHMPFMNVIPPGLDFSNLKVDLPEDPVIKEMLQHKPAYGGLTPKAADSPKSGGETPKKSQKNMGESSELPLSRVWALTSVSLSSGLAGTTPQNAVTKAVSSGSSYCSVSVFPGHILATCGMFKKTIYVSAAACWCCCCLIFVYSAVLESSACMHPCFGMPICFACMSGRLLGWLVVCLHFAVP